MDSTAFGRHEPAEHHGWDRPVEREVGRVLREELNQRVEGKVVEEPVLAVVVELILELPPSIHPFRPFIRVRPPPVRKGSDKEESKATQSGSVQTGQ